MKLKIISLFRNFWAKLLLAIKPSVVAQKQMIKIVNLLAALFLIWFLIPSQRAIIYGDLDWVFAIHSFSVTIVLIFILLISYFLNNFFLFLTIKKLIISMIIFTIFVFGAEMIIPYPYVALELMLIQKIESCKIINEADESFTSIQIIQMLNSKELKFINVDRILLRSAFFENNIKKIKLRLTDPVYHTGYSICIIKNL